MGGDVSNFLTVLNTLSSSSPQCQVTFGGSFLDRIVIVGGGINLVSGLVI